MQSANWKKYWSKQETPLHASTDAGFYQELSREILFHIGAYRDRRVLELGCGDGVLFGDYTAACRSYTGVDFSESLIARYREKDSSLNLVQSDIRSFLREAHETYDVIFSYGVLQYLDLDAVKELFSQQARVLAPGGRCIHFGIPVKELEAPFHQGLGATSALERGRPRGWLQQVKSKYGNKIGHWHSMRTLYAVSQAAGFHTRICANMSYFYRVNLIQNEG